MFIVVNLRERGSLHGEHRLSYYPARFQGPVGLGGLLQGKRRADLDPQFAGVEVPVAGPKSANFAYAPIFWISKVW